LSEFTGWDNYISPTLQNLWVGHGPRDRSHSAPMRGVK